MSKIHFSIIFSLLYLSQGLFAQTSKALAPKDLAIALPLDSIAVPRESFFPKSWFQTISSSFNQTSVGSALETESPYQDWQLISLRIAPCAALTAVPRLADQDCWPEVRLVWQPVQRKIRLHERFMDAAADDRAVHATYPVAASRFLNAEESARINRYKMKLTQGEKLEAAAQTEFLTARKRILQELLPAVLALRDKSLPDIEFADFGLRPETDRILLQKDFNARLTTFLSRFANPSDLRTLTAFSLPEGHEPAHIDEWIFLAFTGENAAISRDSILVRSAIDGRILADLGHSMRGTQTRDDERFYDLLDGSKNATELEATVMMDIDAIRRLTPAIQNRQKLLVPNTSCVSCHKMNELRFDFHNFSYLEDREITISPRVKKDVELDLLWLKNQGF